MFGVDKKGNYGPLSLHDYSDDSDDENDFVSEQIRNQRVSQVVGQVVSWGFLVFGQVGEAAGIGRGVLGFGM